jgi:hypothetical protein
MKVAVKRIDVDGRYITSIMRDDGVSFSMQGVGHNFSIPHDLAHLAIEQALHLDRGFWGSIAAGAVFPTMTYLGGRRKPRSAERSKEILRANTRPLGEAEVLVRIFNDTIEGGHSETSGVLHRRLKGRWAPPGERPRSISSSQIAEAFAAYRDVLSRWSNTPVGGTLELQWGGAVR